MSFLPSNSIQSFVPNDLIIPEDWSEANLILTDYIRTVIDSLNDKEIGQYNTVELVTGQNWFTPGDANVLRGVYRKVVNFGALPNTSIKSVAHGITTTQNTVFTKIYGTATNPGVSTITSSIPLPYVDPAGLANAISLNVDSTNVNIDTGADYSAYTNCYIVLEYIQN